MSMFSKENVRGLSLRFDFPKVTQKKTLDFIKDIRLGSFDTKTPYVYSVLRKLSDNMPIFRFSGDEVKGALTANALTISIGEVMVVPISDKPKNERDKAIAKVFEEKSLTSLNADVNFLIGHLSAIFGENAKKMKGKADIRLIKQQEEKDTSYNCILKDEFLHSVQQISKINLSAFKIKIPGEKGMVSISLSQGKRKLTCEISTLISTSRPLNILALLNDSVTTLNNYYSKLGVN